MNNIIFFFFSFFFFTSCDKTSKIKIINNAKINIDYAEIFINEYKLKIPKLVAGDSLEINFQKDSIFSPHDVVFIFRFYKNDTLLFKGSHFSNDLGFIPHFNKFIITDSLTIYPN